MNFGYDTRPYNVFGSTDNIFGGGVHKQFRSNPLRLWTWDKHPKKHKTAFFGKKHSSIVKHSITSSPLLPGGGITSNGVEAINHTTIDNPDESYIVKIINSEAATSKIFDNAHIVMTPSSVPFSSVEYSTDTTHKSLEQYNSIHDVDIKYDDTEELVINRRWDFNDTHEGFMWNNGTGIVGNSIINIGDSTLTLLSAGTNAYLTSPGDRMNAFNSGGEGGETKILNGYIGKFNNIIRVKLKRTNNGVTDSWNGNMRFRGYNPSLLLSGSSFVKYDYDVSRMLNLPEPNFIDGEFLIAEWDMSECPEWDNCRISGIRIDFGQISGVEYVVDWIEIGGLKAAKYTDGVLKIPLRTEKSTKRSRGTWSKIKYSAKTTDKFNIFAILAKYRTIY